jgi:hypothetical protein
MRSSAGLSYLYADNLGSTMVTTGTAISDERYAPWGTARDLSQQAAVPYRYTGQREEATLGLYDYGARWCRRECLTPRLQATSKAYPKPYPNYPKSRVRPLSSACTCFANQAGRRPRTWVPFLPNDCDSITPCLCHRLSRSPAA